MSAIDYSDKRFLIVDSLKPSRDVLKSLAFNLNPAEVHACSYPNDVVVKCNEQSFDIILLGYDLGEKQRNGQQLLEELRAERLINRNTVVVLVTGEISQSMVLAALEHKPDDYLIKPYTIAELSKRLNRCFVKKQTMRDIYKALDNENSKRVIRLCDEAIANDTPYKTECLGIKSRQYFNLGQYNEAAKIYNSYLNIKNCQWATIGLGRIQLEQKNPHAAIKYFAEIKDKYPFYLSSYDWLATAQEHLLMFIAAQETLEQALTVSPRSVKRVERYAKLCLKNGNIDKATSAFEQNYQLAYNSIHHKPENALAFAYAATEQSDTLSDYQLRVLKNRVFNALGETVKTFNQPATRVQSQLLTVDLMKKTGEENFAERLLESTVKFLEKTQSTIEPEDALKVSKLLINLDRRPPANILINHIVENHHDHVELMTEVDKLVDNNIGKAHHKAAQAALDDALTLYRNGDYQDSIEKLEKAKRLYPMHLGIQFNLVQVLMTDFEENPAHTNSLDRAGNLLNSVQPVSANDSLFQRQKLLEDKFRNLRNISR